MDRGTFLKNVRHDVEHIRNNYQYAQLGDAFAHWSVMQILGLSDDESEIACAISGKNDKGIDAFWCDDEERTIYIFQSKYSEKGDIKVDRETVTAFGATINWLKILLENVRPEVRDAAVEYKKVEQGYEVKMYLVVLGQLTDAAWQEVAQFNKVGAPPGHSMETFDLDKVQDFYLTNLSKLRQEGPDVELELEEAEYYERPGEAVVATVKAGQMAELRRLYHFQIFQRNVRHYLGAKNPVNKQIANTLEDTSEKGHFWHYNNGLSIVCRDYHIDRESCRLQIKNFQIVNGCQTACVLYDNMGKLDDSVKLLIKVMKSPGANGFTDKITLCTNTQTAIKGRDLMSNNIEQIRLQHQFNSLVPPFFFETRAGEWASLAKIGRKKYKETGRHRVIDNSVAAQAYLSFKHHKPAEAKSRKGRLFDPSSDGFYTLIFDGTMAEDLLLPWLLLQKIEQQRNSYRHELRNLEKANFTGVPDEKRVELEDKRFLLHASMHLLAMIGYLLNKRYSGLRITEVLNKLRENDPSHWTLKQAELERLYKSVELELRFLVKEKLQKAPPGSFSFNNYFKNPESIKEIHLALDKAIERDKVKGSDYLSFLP